MIRPVSIVNVPALRAVSITVLLGLCLLPSPASAATCDAGAFANLPNTTIDSAQLVPSGSFVAPVGRPLAVYATLPDFCRITATLKPSADSDIKAEVWLPEVWNRRYLTVGNGGWAGTMPYSSLANSVVAGYAVAGTDTGHVGNNADFALGHFEKLVDLGYRSIHETTELAKNLIAAYYGIPSSYSYYSGCSQGGRQGLAAAQMYPQDFDGIIAGAPSWDQMRAHGARVALNVIVNKSPASMIPASKYQMINDAVLKACDASDGVNDGVIEDPQMCKFNYASLACKSGDAPNCLTKAQVDSAKAMTSPLRDPKSGRVLFEGHLMPGSELGWGTLGGPEPLGLSVSGLRNVVFQDESWDYRKMNISTDVDRAAASDNGAMYSGNPNLKPFFDRGGKLLMYHGWNDPQVNPLNSVIYYRNVLKAVGSEQAAGSIALFMIPGMNHCSGGPGTDVFDRVRTLEEWVEQGKTPTQIIALRVTEGKVDKSRPLCPYPQVAKYKGTGSTDDAANFACGKP